MTTYNKLPCGFGHVLHMVLFCWLLGNILTVSSYDPRAELMDPLQEFDNSVDWGYDDPASLSPNPDILSVLKRGWNYPKRRFGKGFFKGKGGGPKQCGETKMCEGKCCGRFDPICCKRGWTCRYTPRTRSFVCIP